MTTNPVCYRGKGTSPGSFKVPQSAQITEVKLVHVSGHIKCGNSLPGSYWACGCCYKTDTVLTLVTDANNNPLFPSRKFKTQVGHSEISLPGFNHLSPELVLPSPNDGPLVQVSKGDILKIWFGEDFVKYADFNNSGQHCVHVFLKYNY